jgi:hypothetical protein
VPAPEIVLAGLSAIANGWHWLAATWHVLLALSVLMFLAGWRPSIRMTGGLLVAPLLSVSLVAWLSGNPFNGMVMALVGLVLGTFTIRLSDAAIPIASPARVAAGIVLVLFGWLYPHFFTTGSMTDYLFLSPLGTLPCPTLAVGIGLTLIARNLESTSWSSALAASGLFYGLVGVFRLGVALDWGLLLGAALLGTLAARDAHGRTSIRAERRERAFTLPGDELITKPIGTLTHGITIAGPPRAVWPWLAQMGAGNRAGSYSYDRLDNAGVPSATRVRPELQHITVGTIFPALPGVTVLTFDPFRSLVLGWRDGDGRLQVTWAFVLDERGRSTRLLVRVRAADDYRFHGLPAWLSKPAIRLVHFVMQQKQLLGIAQRVESSAAPRSKRQCSRQSGSRYDTTADDTVDVPRVGGGHGGCDRRLCGHCRTHLVSVRTDSAIALSPPRRTTRPVHAGL